MTAALIGAIALILSVTIPALIKMRGAERALKDPAAVEKRAFDAQAKAFEAFQALDECLAENREIDRKWFLEKRAHENTSLRLEDEQQAHRRSRRQLNESQAEINRLKKRLNDDT